MKIHRFERAFIRDKFNCGQPSLNNYILRNANKDVKNGASTCFVIINPQKEVIAYYTLSSESISIEEVPTNIQKKINYDQVPVILLGRLAVDKSVSGKGLGQFLLVDSLKKCLEVSKAHIGAVAVIVDPIDSTAQAFYLKYGFISLPDSNRMFLTMKSIEIAFGN